MPGANYVLGEPKPTVRDEVTAVSRGSHQQRIDVQCDYKQAPLQEEELAVILWGDPEDD